MSLPALLKALQRLLSTQSTKSFPHLAMLYLPDLQVPLDLVTRDAQTSLTPMSLHWHVPGHVQQTTPWLAPLTEALS